MPLCGKFLKKQEQQPLDEVGKYRQTLAKLRSVIESYHAQLENLNPIYEEYIGTLGVFTQSADNGQRVQIIKEAEMCGGVRGAYNSSKKSYEDLISQIQKVQNELNSNGQELMKNRFTFVESIVHQHTELIRKYHGDVCVNMRLVERTISAIKPRSPPSPCSPVPCTPTMVVLPVDAKGQSSSMILSPMTPVKAILVDSGSPSPPAVSNEAPVETLPVSPIVVTLPTVPVEAPVESLPMDPVVMTPPIVPVEAPVESLPMNLVAVTPPIAPVEAPVESLPTNLVVMTPPIAPVEAPVESLPMDPVVVTPPVVPVEAPVEAVVVVSPLPAIPE